VQQEEDSTLQADLMNGKCLLEGRESTLLTFSKPPALRVIQGKANNATFSIDVDNGGWVSSLLHGGVPRLDSCSICIPLRTSAPNTFALAPPHPTPTPP